MEAQEYLGACDCPEYLRRAERRLHEEAERCVTYLDPSSEAKITRVVEAQLIQKQVGGPWMMPPAAAACPAPGVVSACWALRPPL